MLKAGDVLGGSVRLDELIGEGACGWVFRAQQLQLERTVAVKVLKVDDLAEPVDAWKRFQREARLLADVVHPGIVQIFTLDHHERWPYFVMEYLKGRSVAARLKEERQLSIAAALHIVELACDPLAAAHERGIVHRDLKPANLFETDGGDVKVIDFGVARLFAGGDGGQRGRFTETGVLVGTPQFMAPEQARDQDVDARTDVYALGVILYQLLTGRLPFDEQEYSTSIALLGRITAGLDRPTPVREHRADVPDAVAAVVGQCMNYHAINRYQTAGALKEAICGIQLGLRPAAKTSDRTLNVPVSAASLMTAGRRDPAAPSARMPTLEAAANLVLVPATPTTPGKRRPDALPSDVKVTAPETPRAIGVVGSMPPDKATADVASPSTPASRPPAANAATARPATASAAPTPLRGPTVPARARAGVVVARTLAAIVGVAAVATAIIGVHALLDRTPSGSAQPAPPPPASPTPPAQTLPVASPKATAKQIGHVRVVTTPPGARVIVDGAIVGQAPVDVTGTADQVKHVRLELDGFAARDEDVLPAVEGGEALYSLRRVGAAHHRHNETKSSKPTEAQAAPRDRDGIADPFEGK